MRGLVYTICQILGATLGAALIRAVRPLLLSHALTPCLSCNWAHNWTLSTMSPGAAIYSRGNTICIIHLLTVICYVPCQCDQISTMHNPDPHASLLFGRTLQDLRRKSNHPCMYQCLYPHGHCSYHLWYHGDMLYNGKKESKYPQVDPLAFTAIGGGANKLAAEVTFGQAWGMEAILTFSLVMMVFAATDNFHAAKVAHLPVSSRLQRCTCKLSPS